MGVQWQPEQGTQMGDQGLEVLMGVTVPGLQNGMNCGHGQSPACHPAAGLTGSLCACLLFHLGHVDLGRP